MGDGILDLCNPFERFVDSPLELRPLCLKIAFKQSDGVQTSEVSVKVANEFQGMTTSRTRTGGVQFVL